MPLAGKVLLWRCSRYGLQTTFLNLREANFPVDGFAAGYHPAGMALLIIFVGLYVLGSVIVIGATLAALGPDGGD